MNTIALLPSEARHRVLADHQELRSRLDQIQAILPAVERREGDVLATLVHHTRALIDRMSEHIDLEDKILVPAMRLVDAWVARAADDVLAHHAEQRAELAKIATKLPDLQSQPTALVQTVQQLITDLGNDIAYENLHFLQPGVLRDDLVTVTETS